MDIITLKEKVKKTIDSKIVLQKRFIEYIVDPSLSIEERWETYEKYASKVLDLSPYVYNLKVLEKYKLDYYDFFSIERYESVYFSNIIECDIYKLEEYLSEQEIIELKEEIMASGYSGFVFDW